MRRLALCALLALAGCEHVDALQVAGVVAAGLGGAAGGLAAQLVRPAPVPVVVQVLAGPDGGDLVDWPDAGGPCSPVGDRLCCIPGSVTAVVHRDAGSP